MVAATVTKILISKILLETVNEVTGLWEIESLNRDNIGNSG